MRVRLDANVRVVSMPCWELFEEQSEEYREEVLPVDVTERISVEAGITFGWQRWGAVEMVGIDHFGASAPAERIFEEFSLTPENVARVVHAAL